MFCICSYYRHLIFIIITMVTSDTICRQLSMVLKMLLAPTADPSPPPLPSAMRHPNHSPCSSSSWIMPCIGCNHRRCRHLGDWVPDPWSSARSKRGEPRQHAGLLQYRQNHVQWRSLHWTSTVYHATRPASDSRLWRSCCAAAWPGGACAGCGLPEWRYKPLCCNVCDEWCCNENAIIDMRISHR